MPNVDRFEVGNVPLVSGELVTATGVVVGVEESGRECGNTGGRHERTVI